MDTNRETAEMILVTSINALAGQINRWANAKGFWTVPQEITDIMNKMSANPKVKAWIDNAMKAQKLALITTETSEHVEAVRKPDVPSELPGFTSEEEELADQIIRCLDYGAQYKLRIGETILAKMAKNEGRPYKHGKEF